MSGAFTCPSGHVWQGSDSCPERGATSQPSVALTPPPAGDSTLVTASPDILNQPPRLPGYELLRELGRGGMGVVLISVPCGW